MHPDGSVTRCLVCPAAADGPGPALCLPDCCTTERIRIPHIHRQQSALLCRRILYEGLTHIFFPQFVIQVKGCSLAVDGSCGEKPYRHVRAHLACSTCSLSGFLPVAGSSLGVNHRGASWSNSQRVRAQRSLKRSLKLQPNRRGWNAIVATEISREPNAPETFSLSQGRPQLLIIMMTAPLLCIQNLINSKTICESSTHSRADF